MLAATALPPLLLPPLLLLLPVQASKVPLSPSPACVQATERATLAAGALRDYFWNESAGLWDEDLWWENACTLEAISSYA